MMLGLVLGTMPTAVIAILDCAARDGIAESLIAAHPELPLFPKSR